LDHMIRLYHAGNEDVKPDVFSYTATFEFLGSCKE
jgi:hypothetical protein